LEERNDPITARARATRQRLLVAAEHEFGKNGFHSTSVGTIASRAGVAVGTFYLYFVSKDAALCSVLNRIGDRVHGLLKTSASSAQNYLEGEQRRIDAYVRYMSENRAIYRIVQEAAFLVEKGVFREYQRKISETLPTHYVVDFHGLVLREHFVRPRTEPDFG
jgi:AcrR family transcriptional regulator